MRVSAVSESRAVSENLITFANNALCADGYTPSQDPNRTLQECYKNALANANGNTVHP